MREGWMKRSCPACALIVMMRMVDASKLRVCPRCGNGAKKPEYAKGGFPPYRGDVFDQNEALTKATEALIKLRGDPYRQLDAQGKLPRKKRPRRKVS